MAMFGRIPMFGADAGPRYTGPFNAGGKYGPMLDMIMPQLLQMLMGSEHMPAQFWPEQDIYTQMEANKYMEASQQAMALASRRDRAAMERMMGGVIQTMTGKPLSEMQQAQTHRIAGGISQFMPILSQVLGPDLIDQLHGSRGSATIFAQQFHQAMRTGIDPITHKVGYSGESVGAITQDVFEQVFGQNADIGLMKGLSAGQAGTLMNELQARGMLGEPLGLKSVKDQRAMLPRELREDIVHRLAERLPEVQQVLAAGGTPNEDLLNVSRQKIRDSFNKLTDKKVDMSRDDLAQLPGGEDIIRVGEADRITGRLKNLSGAVKAMRDIFGDMGRPNAPMREIINGLEALTQGGLSTMAPGDLEMMVRKTQAIAKQTGVGVEGIMALSTQNAALADKLGLDRSFAVQSAQQSALFGAAAGDRLRLDIPVWGALNKEQIMLGDDQLRMHAAASPLANQLNAVLRMADTGMARPREGTELAAFLEAARRRQTEYTFDGRQRSMVMPHTAMLRMLERDAGVKETEAFTMLNDISGNQEFGLKYNTADTVRRLQNTDTVRRMLMPVLGNRIRGMMTDQGLNEISQAQGITGNEAEFREMMNQIGAGVGQDFIDLDPEVVRSESRQRQAMGQAFRRRLRDAVKQRMPKATDQEIDTIVGGMVDQMGGEAGLEKMGTAIGASINQTARAHPNFKSAIGMHDILSKEVMQQTQTRDRQAEIARINQSALSGLGTADPIRRLADVFQQAGPDSKLSDLLSTALGGIKVDAIKAADPEGGLAKVFDLMKENNQLDPNDPAQLEQVRRNAAMIKGLVEGGDVAAAQLKLMDESRKRLDDPAKATAEQRARAIEELTIADNRETRLQQARLTNEQKSLDAVSERLREAGDVALDPAKRSAAQQMASRTTRSLVQSLGKQEIDLGGRRFLTSQGIIRRDAEGEIVDRQGFDNPDVVKEAAAVMQKRHDDAAAKLRQRDGFRETETQADKLDRAAASGLLRGELTTGNERLYKNLQDAAKRDSNTSLMGDYGYQLGARVSIDQVEAVRDGGALAAKLLLDKSADKAERASAVSTFVLGSRERARQLLEDERSMKIIGSGGLELLNSIMGGSGQLQQMADAQSKKLKKTITVSDILMGEKGVSAETTAEAKKLFDSMQAQWSTVAERRGFGMLPGKGDDPRNKARAAMTEQEEKDLQHQQEFIKQHATAEERAASVFDRMAALATPAQKARMSVDINREKIIKAIAEGDRGVSLDRALQGREGLLQMGLRKGIFGKKTRVSDLSEAEILGAADKLDALGLDDRERADLKRLRRDSSILMDFGMPGLTPKDVTQDILHRVKQATPTQLPPPPDAKDKELKVTVTGNVTQRTDGTVDLSLEGRGLLDQVMNATGLV